MEKIFNFFKNMFVCICFFAYCILILVSFMVMSDLFEGASYGDFEIALLIVSLIIPLVKNLITVFYIQRLNRNVEKKTRVVRLLVLADWITVTLPFAYFIAFLVVGQFDAITILCYYLLFVLVYFIYIIWASHTLWHSLKKKHIEVFYKNFIIRDKKCKRMFVLLVYTINFVLGIMSVLSLSIHTLMRSTRPWSIIIISFSIINCFLLLVFAFSKNVVPKHFFIMTIVVGIILLVSSIAFGIPIMHAEIVFRYGVNLIVFVPSTLIVYYVAKKTGDSPLS